MTDIAIHWDALNNRADWRVVNGDLESGHDLISAVYVSLFSDRRAQPGDMIPDGTDDPRGWWGDIQTNGSEDPIGSRLWLLSREKQTQQTLNRAVTYAKEALQWMLNDGLAANVIVTANWNGPSFLALRVTIYRQDGTVVPLNFNWAWSQL